MDDVERAIDDGVNNYKALTRDGRFVPGAGATEIELANQIARYGEVRWLHYISLAAEKTQQILFLPFSFLRGKK